MPLASVCRPFRALVLWDFIGRWAMFAYDFLSWLLRDSPERAEYVSEGHRPSLRRIAIQRLGAWFLASINKFSYLLSRTHVTYRRKLGD